ncbi:MAG: hypothetical protein MUF35_01430 [Candidatus Nanopelagicales bacterium]|jgi:hypothetical protein|nr:hypothetical protein [Candidatus Nanopelagicales bacterium]
MRCPRCGTELDPTIHDDAGMTSCSCGLRAYAGFLAEAESLDARRAWLADRIAAGDPPPRGRLAAQYRVWPPPIAGAAHGRAGHVPRATGAPSAQTILLGVGALLLVIAGAVFAAVVWDRLGAVGQVALMLTATVGVGALAIRLRTGLRATAEALAVVAAGLAAVDLLAAPALGLVPERWLTDPTLYPALAVAALGLALLLLHARFGLRAWSWLGWLALPVAAGCVVPAVDRATDTPAWPAASLAVPALASVAILAAASLLPAVRTQRHPMLLAGGAGLLVSGLGTAASASDRAALPGALVTTALTAAALVAWVLGERAAVPPAPGTTTPTFERTGLLALGATALVGAALAMALALPPAPQPAWLALVVAAAGLALGLALLGLVGDRALAVVAAASTWLAWAWLRLNVVDPLGSSDVVQDQLALLAAAVAVIALVVAWWLPWTGWVGAVLGELALVLGDWELEAVEAYTLPFAALLLLAGLLWRRQRPGPSLHWLGPAVAAALIPSAVATLAAPWAWGDPGADTAGALVRLGAVLVAGVLAAVAGARWRLGGLLIPAAVALTIAALGQLVSGLANLPRWVGLGLAGILLIATGARVEALRREGHRAAAWVGGLR